METWQVTLLTAGMTFIGGLLLGRQSEKREERQRKAQRTQVYADKAIKVLSKTKVTLAELRPEGLIAESEPGQSRQRVHDAINEYIDAKQPLIEVAFGHPKKEVRDALSQVDDNALALMKATSLFVVSFSPGLRQQLSTKLPKYADDAKQAFDALQASIHDALALLHEDGRLSSRG